MTTPIKKTFMKNGMILINALIFAAISVSVTLALINWGAAVLKSTKQLHLREQALQIAEAGIEYYRWHLAHAPTDYKDGTTNNGPYVHDMKDADGNVIGQYSLTITPPPVGSKVVTIESKGTLAAEPTVSRTIRSKVSVPTFARFAVIANGVLSADEGTEVFGPLHSNNGIRFDGVAHNLVTSAMAEWNDPNRPGGKVFGIYTTRSPADPNPPAAPPLRPEIFMAGRQFPVPQVDFTGLTLTLSELKALAQSGGRYIPASNAQGYHLVLKPNDTFDVYKVTELYEPHDQRDCKIGENEGGWGIWSIVEEEFLANYPFPANGITFVEDNFWIDGRIDGAHLTFAAARFPSSNFRNIVVNHNLLYTKYDGSDTIGLIAQGDITVGLMSDNVLRIDAALISQEGRAGRYHFNDKCGEQHIRDSLTLYGMIASYGRYGFAYTDGTGYLNRTIIFDENLISTPPPSFPLTSNQFQIISWEEVN